MPEPIPTTFHFAWFGGPLPDEYGAYMDTWKRHHPSWRFILWNDNLLPRMRHRIYYEQAKHPAYKAEIVRLEAVLQMGGVWVDTDFECFKAIDPLLKGIEAFSAWQYEDRARAGAIACGIFGATPNHPWMEELVAKLPTRWMPDRMSVGPWYFTPITMRHPEVHVFPRELFYPYSSGEKHRKGETFPAAYAAHHWAGTWVKHHKATLAREKGGT